MTTQFPDATTDTTTTLTPTAARVTPPPTRPFANVLRAGRDAVIDGAEAAAQRLPGGPLVSAALRPGFHGPAATAALGPPTLTTAPTGIAAGEAGGGDPMSTAVQAQADNAMYFLRLQSEIQEENRTYSTLSNVLKARHETVKNAIGNLR
jgi:hypothetical protein